MDNELQRDNGVGSSPNSQNDGESRHGVIRRRDFLGMGSAEAGLVCSSERRRGRAALLSSHGGSKTPSRRGTRALRAVSVMLALAASFAMVEPEAVADDRATSTTGDSITVGFDPDPGLPDPEPNRVDDALAAQQYLNSLANDFGISVDEARLRSQIQVSTHELNEWLAKEYPQRYAGTRIARTPPFTIIVAMTDVDPSVVQGEISTWFHDAGSVRVDTVKYSLVDLFAIYDSLLDEIPAESLDVDERVFARVNARNNVVEVRHPDARVGIALAEAYPADAVVFEVGLDDVVDHSDYIGGWGTSGSVCTSGFTVRKDGSRESGATTAEHCTNVSGINGISEPFGPVAGSVDDSKVDARWFPLTHRNWTPRNQIKINDQGTRATITGRVQYYSVSTDDYFCKYGRTTGYSCGPVESIACCSPGHQYVEAGYHAEGGDSGGPVYEFAEPYFSAVGLHMGGNSSNSLFSSLTFVEQAFGVTVATSTPPTPAFDWFLRNSNSQGTSNSEWEFGDSSATVVRGRWTSAASGRDRPGSFQSGVWDLEGQGRFSYGLGSDIPIVGDWDNDDIDEVGLYSIVHSDVLPKRDFLDRLRESR